jgi:chemotaxis protein methyltransferase WspC
MMDRHEALAQRAGFMLDPLGRRALERIDPDGPDALEQAAEVIAVPETWFFRDREPFVYLGEFAAAHLRGAASPLRVLSAPCSTGEEPYSAAMALLDAGIKPDAFTIDAVDISRKAIDAARRAAYGRSSFRHPMPEIIDRYFRPQGSEFALRPEVTERVRFVCANLLEQPAPRSTYHAIFCRNLMIYLHEQARRQVIATMRLLLAEGGVLFAGHSEIALLIEAGFERVPHPRSFACRKRAPASGAGLPACAVVSRKAPAQATKPAPRATAPDPPRRPLKSSPSLEDAQRLADRGRLAEAMEIGKALPPSAGAFCLLGLICQSENRLAEAEEHFGRALYLDPAHQESLVHMSLLYESRGDARRAATFRQRAARAATKDPGGRG